MRRDRLRHVTWYARHLARHTLMHPLDGAERIRGRVDMRLDLRRWDWAGVAPSEVYEVADDWQERLHRELDAPWPCPVTASGDRAWAEAIAAVRAAGVEAGERAYGLWDDGDISFARAVWCTVEHLRPAVAVETGVAHGVVSSLILDRLLHAGHGHLWSVDLPEVDPVLQRRTGIAVPAALQSRWTYVEGSSMQRLPGVIANLPDQIDIFVHDSLHSARNVRFELDAVWERLRPGGVVIVDDISVNFAFHWFVRAVRPAMSFAAPHGKGSGLWGFAMKDGAAGPGEPHSGQRP